MPYKISNYFLFYCINDAKTTNTSLLYARNGSKLKNI
jgi:hypothetical protein